MNIACLCPTYNRLTCLPNAVALFNRQSHPNRKLLILDDGKQWHTHHDQGTGINLFSSEVRFSSLPSKYKFLMYSGAATDAEVFAIWDDDDIYLPWHLEEIAKALQDNPQSAWCYSKLVGYWHAPNPLKWERTDGRHWACIAFRRSVLWALSEWFQDRSGQFDQNMLRRLQDISPPAYVDQASFIYRCETGAGWHSQNYIQYPEDEGWYNRVPPAKPCYPRKRLESCLSDDTSNLLSSLFAPRSLPQE